MQKPKSTNLSSVSERQSLLLSLPHLFSKVINFMATELLRAPHLNIFPALIDDDDAVRQGTNEDCGNVNACLGLGLASGLLLPSACSMELP